MKGEACESCPNITGIYTFEADLNNGYPCWSQKGGENFIWFGTNCSDDNVWQIGPKNDKKKSALCSRYSNLKLEELDAWKEMDWKYKNNDNWEESSNIRIGNPQKYYSRLPNQGPR